MPLSADRFTYPVSGGYKRHGEAVRNGEYLSTNPIGTVYPLRGSSAVHEGDDIAKLGQPCLGDPVYAIANGIVTFAQDVTTSTWRKMVEIEHTLPDGTKVWSRYAHLKEMIVAKGQAVTVGQPIGTIGDAEGAFVPHLHFSICVTRRMVSSPLDWPSTGHGVEEAKAIVAENYTDPIPFIRVRLQMQQPPVITPQQMIQAAQEAILQINSLLTQALAALTPAPSTTADVPPVTTPTQARVNSDIGLNARAAPTIKASIPGKIPHGEVITVLDDIQVDGYQWCKVLSGEFTGCYVAKQFLAFDVAVQDSASALG